MAKKTHRRLLAEAIAKEKGVKLKSAMRYLQRISVPAESGKQRIKSPRYSGLPDKLRKRIKRAGTKPKERVRKSDLTFPETIPARREKYRSGTTMVRVTGDFFGYEKRGRRTVHLSLTADEANELVNARNNSDVSNVLTNLTREGWLSDPDMKVEQVVFSDNEKLEF